MAETYTSSSSSNEQFRLVDLKLPTLTDQNIKSDVLQTHGNGFALVQTRQPLLVSICNILKPATNFIDSVLLGNKVSENGYESKISEFHSELSDLRALIGDRRFSIQTLLDMKNLDDLFLSLAPTPLGISTISELRALAGHNYFMILARLMENPANNAVQMFEEINVHQVSMDLLRVLSDLSWDVKAVISMGCFVLKFLEFLGQFLNGPNLPISELTSTMAALKENPISLVGSPLEKFQAPLSQLNNLIKLTLEVIYYIRELSLLSDTENSKEDLLSTSVHWAILSMVACYIQITLLLNNEEVALELVPLTSSLSQIQDNLKHHCSICKSHIEEMEAYLKKIAVFEDAFSEKGQLQDPLTEMPKLMESFMHSKDGFHSLIDGSTMSEVSLEVLKEKAIIFFITDLDIESSTLTRLQKHGNQYTNPDAFNIVLRLIEEEHFPKKRIDILGFVYYSAKTSLPELYPQTFDQLLEGDTDNLNKPPSNKPPLNGFERLRAKFARGSS
ncbi:hypothetical protein L6164_013072 [Bauhinia variegata]|uniref:Uncharacterized protein n=1 Tax=Bauhinia variegata TaxID=167791 RepID=A0ACB9PBZ2_BAUVA|nr:hypothetical protein L6164_013072 [Bauhinia variegata]